MLKTGKNIYSWIDFCLSHLLQKTQISHLPLKLQITGRCYASVMTQSIRNGNIISFSSFEKFPNLSISFDLKSKKKENGIFRNISYSEYHRLKKENLQKTNYHWYVNTLVTSESLHFFLWLCTYILIVMMQKMQSLSTINF